MPYQKSRSRQEFEVSSSKLFSLSRAISYKKVKLSYEHKNLIYQSCIVLLSSCFEEFLRILVEDIFQNYKLNNAPLSDIPANARTYILFQNQKKFYDGFNYDRDEGKVIEKLSIKSSLYSLTNENIAINDHLQSKILINDKKYPSPKNLKILFNRLGIKNIFAIINNSGQKDYSLLLRSFLDVRETIAHQESTDLTFEDIRRHYKNINDIINRIDRASYSHICSESGSKYWL